MMTQQTIDALNHRLCRAANKYGPMDSDATCMGAIAMELHEVHLAMHARDAQQTYAELLDVANVAIRRAQAIAALTRNGDTRA